MAPSGLRHQLFSGGSTRSRRRCGRNARCWLLPSGLALRLRLCWLFRFRLGRLLARLLRRDLLFTKAHPAHQVGGGPRGCVCRFAARLCRDLALGLLKRPARCFSLHLGGSGAAAAGFCLRSCLVPRLQIRPSVDLPLAPLHSRARVAFEKNRGGTWRCFINRPRTDAEAGQHGNNGYDFHLILLLICRPRSLRIGRRPAGFISRRLILAASHVPELWPLARLPT